MTLKEYRWEESADHACGVCGVKANNPKSIRTCHGKHSEPCVNYHQTMFVIGNSSGCKACCTSEETHRARHKGIADLVADLKGPEPTVEESSGTPKKMWSRAQRIAGESKRDRKARESLEKAQRNEQRYTVPLTTSNSDEVAKILHGPDFDTNGRTGMPDGGSAAMFDTMYERMDRFTQSMGDHQDSLLQKARTRRHRKGYRRASITYAHREELALSIMFDLGVIDLEASGYKPIIPDNDQLTKLKRATLLQRLQTAIEKDLSKHSNELRDRNKRMNGYWHFVNKGVLDRLAKAAESIDRVTGVIIHDGDDNDVSDDNDDSDGEVNEDFGQVQADDNIRGDDDVGIETDRGGEQARVGE